jgi:hypothetical protein
MSDIPITWKKITRGLPKMRRHADDRAPTIEEIQKICEYPEENEGISLHNGVIWHKAWPEEQPQFVIDQLFKFFGK